MINRRIWIKQILIAGGGVLLLPACMNDEGAVSVKLKNIKISNKEELLLTEICETIIPATDTLGAKALNLQHFVLKMFDDYYDKPEQSKLVNGLRELNAYTKKDDSNGFVELTTYKKLALLRGIPKLESASEDLKFFLNETRRWVIKGYDTSGYVMTKLLPYEQVPGRFHGCISVNKSIRR